MIDKQEIILMVCRDGKSQRAVERETGINRKTIRKYVKEYESKRQELLNNGATGDVRELTDSIVEAPKYNSSTRAKRKLTDEVIKEIQGYLEENKEKIARGQRKQQKKENRYI